MEQEKMDCEKNGGTWTEVEGTWKCVHPQSSTDSTTTESSNESSKEVA